MSPRPAMPYKERCKYTALASAAFLAAAALQGCSGSGSTSTTTTTAPTGTTTAPRHHSTTTTTAPTGTTTAPRHHEFSLNPIEMQGQHLYDSVTKKPFFAVGIGFPNLLPNDPEEWISVLKRIGELGKNVNMIRLYEVPPCIWNDVEGSCFLQFMKEADRLGIYVLFPGTGAASGYIPRDGWETAQECYQKGGALDMGRGIVQRASYPNTLGIVVGNEFFQGKDTFRAASVFKAYARDMKAYMKMCRDDRHSPSNGVMREIPIMYADRDLGDDIMNEVMSYFKCGSADISIDIYGLNEERWCDPVKTDAYDSILKTVESANLPGTFMFSEMGCPQNHVSSPPPSQTCRDLPVVGRCCPRNWNQVPEFFEKYPMFDGFSAYAYWNDGAMNFNMLDSQWGNATLYFDGKNFFNQTNVIKKAKRPITEGKHPTCAKQVNGVDVLPLEGIKAYNEDKYTAATCPAPKYMSRRVEMYV